MYDVIIVGGSYAGLSAALTLGRSRRKVLVIDAGRPANRFTPHAHNFITQDGRPPEAIREAARRDVNDYPSVSFLSAEVIKARATDAGFTVVTVAGEELTARKLLLSTGVHDLLPDNVGGYRECWGKTIIHCPYCHGYEHRDQATGVWVNGSSAVHYAKLVRNLTQQVVVFTNGDPTFDPADLPTGVALDTRLIDRVDQRDGQIEAVVFRDGSRHPLSVLYNSPPFTLPTDVSHQLGLEHSDAGHIVINSTMETSSPGVFAAGDCATAFRSVAMATMQGNIAGATLNSHLL